jgi:deazaflavin-dependent oxidoreductase (nitroreductase family)
MAGPIKPEDPGGSTMDAQQTRMTEFREPAGIEKLFNKVMGALAGWGFAPKDVYQLEVRGRKSGRFYKTPVNVMDTEGKRYLIAPRGRTQWVRNAEAAGEILLTRGASRDKFQLRQITGERKDELLKMYLERYVGTVQRYFPVKAGSPAEAFREIAGSYPVFELTRAGKGEH